MPAVLPVAAGFAASSAAAAAGWTLASSVLIGVAAGAVVGAGVALAKGENVLKGAIFGALGGAAGGAMGASGLLGSGSVAAGAEMEAMDMAAGVGLSPAASAGISPETAAGLLSAAPETSAAMPPVSSGGAFAGEEIAGTAGKNIGGKTAKGGILNWMNENPYPSLMIGQGLSKSAGSMLEANTSQKQIDALMERDRLNRIRGLASLNYESAIPKTNKFTEKPKWMLDTTDLSKLGLLQG